MLQKHSIAVNSRRYGITFSFVSTYITIRQQHGSPSTDSAELEGSSAAASSSQNTPVKLPKLSPDEAEVHFIYEPAIHAITAPFMTVEEHRVSMDPDPCPDSVSQKQRFVAIVRLPRRQWIDYKYDTGKNV